MEILFVIIFRNKKKPLICYAGSTVKTSVQSTNDFSDSERDLRRVYIDA